MKTTHKSIGSFDAKTHLARLLEEVQGGAEFVITKRGKPVAKLIKYRDMDENIEMKELLMQFDTIRNSVKGKVNVKEYIHAGRKY